MSDAQERIWATGDGRNGSWTHVSLPEKWNAAQTEYIRSDLHADAIARAERAEKALTVAAELVDAIWNQWRDECWTGTPKGCKCEVVGFLRPYYDSKLQHIEDVSKTIRGSIAALKGGAA